MNTDLLYYLIYPAVVALGTSFANYLATKHLTRESQKETDRKRAKDLVDRFINEIIKLMGILDKLNEELQKNNYFGLATLYSANPIISKLNLLLNEITVLTNDKLRQQITSEIDKSTTLINDIDNVESNPVRGWQDLIKLTQERETEYRSIQIRLLEQDIYYDGTEKKFKYISKRTDGKKQNKTQKYDAKLETVEGVLQNLLKDLTKGQQELDAKRAEASNRRTYLAINILALKQSLKELINELQEKG